MKTSWMNGRLGWALAALLSMSGVAIEADAAPARRAPAPKAKPEATAAHRVLVGAKVMIGDGTTIDDGFVEIRGERIVAVGPSSAAKATGAERIDLRGKVVTPGFIAVGTPLGLTEIDMEATTRDVGRDGDDLVRAAHDPALGLNAESTVLQVQAIEGITSAAVTPVGGLVSGQVAWIDLLPEAPYGDLLARRQIAVQAHLGQVYAASHSATIDKLLEVFDDAVFYRRNRAAFDRRQARDLSAHPRDLAALQPMLDGRIPLVVTADRVGDLRALIEIKRQRKLDIVVVGGAQAWKIADALAAADIPIIVQPSSNLPDGIDRLGARLDNAALLHEAGVELGIAVLGDTHNARNVKQEAGLAVSYGLSPEAAMRAISLNLARMYGMDRDYGSLAAGKVANVVVWDGDPFELSNFATAVYVRGRPLPMRSRQTELRDRYRRPGAFRR